MKRLTTHIAVLWGILIMGLFLVLYQWLGREIPRAAANIILLGTATSISIGYWPAAKNAFSRGVTTGRDLIIVTIWLSWTALLIQRVYTIVNEGLNRPDWITESPASIVVAVLIMVAGIYAIVAPITDPEVLSREKVWDIFAIITGAFVAVVAAILYYFTRIGG